MSRATGCGRAAAIAVIALAAACSSTGPDRVETSGTAAPQTPVATTVAPSPTASPTSVASPDGPDVPLDELAEAQDIPFAECETIEESGPPAAAELARLEALRNTLMADSLFDQPFVVGLGGPESIWGVISVGFSRRFQPSIDWLAARTEAADVCVELPPVGYYDRALESAVWELAEPVEPGQREVTLLVDSAEQGCGYNPAGRMLEPQVDYRVDEVEIIIPLDHVAWGAHTCEGWAPAALTVELAEEPAGRALVGGGQLPE